MPFVWRCKIKDKNMKKVVKKLVLINVLHKEYFEDCHIPGSINIPHDQFESRIASLAKYNEYVIYCAVITCPLSRQCTKLLVDAKFPHVAAYEGGMAEWYQKGYPVQGPAKLDYLREEIALNIAWQHDIPTISAEQLLEKMK